jgi:hypothetical protein
MCPDRALDHDLRIPRWLAVAILLIAGAGVAVLTLTPVAGPSGGSPSPCLLGCGSRWVADLIANVLLFAPLGVGLALLGVGWSRILLLGLLASGAVELAQVGLVAGRDANLADVVSNALGAALGGMVGLALPALLLPAPAAVRRNLGVGVASFVALVLAAGILLAPALPHDGYRSRWRARGESYHPYEGDVLRATIGGLRIGRDRTVDSAFRELFAAGAPLEVVIVAGAGGPGRRHIFELAEGGSDVLFIGAEGDDLVLRYRSRSTFAGLDRPSARLEGALAHVTAGDEVTLRVWRSGGWICLTAGARTACPVLTPASSWKLIQDAGAFSGWLQERVSRAWIALLALPLGLWTRRDRRSVLLLVAVVLGLVTLPSIVGLAPLRVGEAIAAAAGWGAGLLVHLYLVRRPQRRHSKGGAAAAASAE